VALAVGLVVFLDYMKFEQTLTRVVESRLIFAAKELKSTIQTGLDLGLELRSLGDVQTVIDRQAAADSAILSIDVVAPDGAVLFSTGSPDQGQVSYAGWRARAGAADLWRQQDDRALVIGTTLVNNFGQIVGGVTIRFSRASLNRVTSGMLGEIGRISLIAFALTALVAVAVVPLVFRRTKRSFVRIGRLMEALRQSPAPPPFVADPASELEVHAAGLQTRLQTIRGKIAQARAELLGMTEET
jgi:hypothetical protein